ncbi:MAG: RagB/SusD family nutrient uptake outer membrane protein [Alistipes sp.]|nr:RagB/SusD family nutrient uptake outer membrane protein [Alistipes sp.]
MKPKIIIPILAALFCFSCEDTLETKTVNEWDEDYVWRIPELAEGVLLQAYSSLPRVPDSFDNNFLDVATDNAVTNAFSSNVYLAGAGGISAQNNPLSNWENCFVQLQRINIFMERGLTDEMLYNRVDSVQNANIKQRLEGEAYYLRAYWSFMLLQRHGGRADDGSALGYPILKHFIDTQEGKDLASLKRNTYEECVASILEDLDSAIVRLPEKYTGSDNVVGVTRLGRGDASAAGALKSRVTLYAASPAYQPSSVVDITGMGWFTVKDQEAYRLKWERAALVADSLLDTSGYENFYGMKPTDIAGAGATTPAEFLFRIYFNTNGMESRHSPPYYHGAATTVPSHNLARAYPCRNGFPTDDPRSGYDSGDPYSEDRDERFNWVLFHHGSNYGSDEIDVVYGGKDSRSYSLDATRTGYYLSKFLANTGNMLTPTQTSTAIHYYPMLRRAEVFLNYAEAANEAWGPHGTGPGCRFSAYEVIRDVRAASAGITDTQYLDEVAAQGKDAFRTLVQNERRLEFAFENHRFYDMRRWLLPLDETVTGIEVTRDAAGNLSFSEFDVEDRRLDDIRYYYLPIPHSEILKSPGMVNNTGW